MSKHNVNFAFLFSGFLFLASIFFACESDPKIRPDNPNAFPDFSNCNCDQDSLNIVCTNDGKWFRTDCFANCIGVENLADSTNTCPDSIINVLDTLTWPIYLVCHPVEPMPPIVARLSDSTFIFHLKDSSFIRGIPYNICLCLPGETLISGPQGQIPVSTLREGDKVFTKNLQGAIEIQPIIQMNRQAVSADHQILHICLEDGRELSLTPEHPGVDGKGLTQLKIGDHLDGSRVISKEMQKFNEKITWDLLPAGETGVYLADGIWIGSTLKQTTKVYSAPITD